ncbi:hypothetical protein Salpa_1476 [Sporomusa sp. KB1]|nr:hypothetical protein Salpa_1476 [Sporomusa sp. KB1]
MVFGRPTFLKPETIRWRVPLSGSLYARDCRCQGIVAKKRGEKFTK